MWIVVEGKDTGLVSIWKFKGDENTDTDARQHIIQRTNLWQSEQEKKELHRLQTMLRR